EPLAGHVGHDHSDRAAGEVEHVVTVPADLRRGAMVALDHEGARACRALGKEGSLDPLRQLHLVGQALPLDEVRLRLLQLAGHLIDGGREESQLRPIPEHEWAVELAAPDSLDAMAQRCDRAEELRHEDEGHDDGRAEKECEQGDLLAPRVRDHPVQIAPGHAHHREPEASPVRMRDRNRRQKRAPVLAERLAGSQSMRILDGTEPRGQRVALPKTPDVGMPLDDAANVRHDDHIELRLAREDLLRERMQRELRIVPEHGSRAREGERAGVEQETGLDFRGERSPGVPLRDGADAHHRTRGEEDRGHGHDPSYAPDDLSLALGHCPSPSSSRVRASCFSARAMYPLARASSGSTASTLSQSATASSSFPAAKEFMPRIRYSRFRYSPTRA